MVVYKKVFTNIKEFGIMFKNTLFWYGIQRRTHYHGSYMSWFAHTLEINL